MQACTPRRIRSERGAARGWLSGSGAASVSRSLAPFPKDPDLARGHSACFCVLTDFLDRTAARMGAPVKSRVTQQEASPLCFVSRGS